MVAVFAYLLALSLLFLATSAVFSYLASKPEKIKEVLSNSGVYEKMPGVAYENIKKENQDETSQIDLSDPQVKQAALDSFDPQFFQASLETAIDGTYAWLEGETSRPEFQIDATGARNEFIGKIVDAKADRAVSLPVCSFQRLRQMDPGTVDIFNLECLPPGVSVTAEAEKVKAELANNPDFLGETKFNSRDLKNEAGEPIFSNNSDLPDKFQLARNVPALLAVLSVLLAGGVYLASTDKRKGLIRIAKILVGAGAITLLAPFFINFTSNKLLPTAANDKMTAEIVSPVIREFNAAAAGIYYLVGGILVFAGILLLLAIYKNILKFPQAKK